MLTVLNGGKGGRIIKTEVLTLGGVNNFEKKKSRSVVICVEYQKPVHFCYSMGTF